MTSDQFYLWIREYLMTLLAGMVSYGSARKTTDIILLRLDGRYPRSQSPPPWQNRQDPDVPYSLIDFLALCDGHELDDLNDEMVAALLSAAFRSGGNGGKAYLRRLDQGERPQVAWVEEAFVRLSLLEPRR